MPSLILTVTRNVAHEIVSINFMSYQNYCYEIARASKV